MSIGLTLLLLLAAPDPADSGPGPRVRGASINETRIIDELLARSETARDLIAEIETTDLIVYVQFSVDKPAGTGATRLAAASARYRYVRIVLGATTSPRQRGALLAHELQHALEIGRAADVRDEQGMRRLYAQIGEDSTAHSAFETAAARKVGARVHQELTRPSARRRSVTTMP